MLVETAYLYGARTGEVCGRYVEDLDPRLDDGTCGSMERRHVRTVLLDDRGHVTLLKSCTWPVPATGPGWCADGINGFRRAHVLRRRPSPSWRRRMSLVS